MNDIERQVTLYAHLDMAINELLTFIRKEIFGKDKIATELNYIKDNYWTPDANSPITIEFGMTEEKEVDKLPTINLLIMNISAPALDVSDGFERVIMTSDADPNYNNVFDVHNVPMTMRGVFMIRSSSWLEQFYLSLYLYTSLVSNKERIATSCRHVRIMQLGGIQLAPSKDEGGIYNAQIGFNMTSIITTYIEDKLTDVTRQAIQDTTTSN